MANSFQLGSVHQIWKKFPISDKMTSIAQAIHRKGDGNQGGRGLHKLSCLGELGKMATRQKHTASTTTSKYQTNITNTLTRTSAVTKNELTTIFWDKVHPKGQRDPGKYTR